MSSDSTPLLIARGVSTVGLGLTAGFMATISTSTISNLYRVDTLSPRDRLHLWSRTYDSGAAIMMRAVPVLTLLCTGAALKAQPPAMWLHANFVGRHRRAFLALAGFLTFLNAPYTFAFIIPRVKRLKKIEKGMVEDAAEGNGQLNDDRIDSEVQTWLSQHHLRSAMGVAAFCLSVAELLCA